MPKTFRIGSGNFEPKFPAALTISGQSGWDNTLDSLYHPVNANSSPAASAIVTAVLDVLPTSCRIVSDIPRNPASGFRGISLTTRLYTLVQTTRTIRPLAGPYFRPGSIRQVL